MNSFTQTFRIYEMLNKYFRNEEDAKAVASGIEDMVMSRFQPEKERLATKMDIMELKGDICNVRVRMRQSYRDQLKIIVLIMLAFFALNFCLLIFWGRVISL